MRRLGSAGLTYSQVFLLVIGFGLASSLIFLFGMWVGRDMAERRLAQDERVVRAPIPARPTADSEGPKEGDVHRAFYERMKEKALQRIQEGAPDKATATPSVSRPEVIPTATSAPTIFSPRPTQRPSPRPTGTAKPRPAAEAPVADLNGWADAGWTVQVIATTSVDEARNLVLQLRSRGYDAYTVEAPTRGGPTLYRVRVGRFTAAEKARALDMEARLRREENLPNARTMPR
jgi:cell division septation protein DedD